VTIFVPRKTGAAVVAAFTVAISSGAAAQSPSVISLKQAVGEALTKNERLLDQHDTIAQSDLSVRLARNEFRPKVTPNILGSFGQTNVSSQTYRVDVSQKLVTGTELRASTGTVSSQIPGAPSLTPGDIHFYNADTTFTVSQPLLRGLGRTVTRRSLTSAEVRREDADIQQALAEQQVAIDVAAAYYRVVSQKAFVSVARQSLDRSRRLRDASEAKLDAGLVSQLDVLRAQQLVAQAESQLFDAQAGVEDARDQLLFLMGRRSDELLDVETEVPRAEVEPIDSERAVALALTGRLDLRSRTAARADAERQAQFARNQLLPQLDVNFALTRRETSNTLAKSFGLDGYQFATFFTIAMPVDRTAQQIDYQTAILDRNRRSREITTLERQIGDDVRRAVRERDRLVRSLTTAETSVTIARSEVVVAQARYERGLSNNLDVVTAEAELLNAESRRIQARSDAAVARLRLRATLGVFNPRSDIGSGGETASAIAATSR
jgi:outer membrane protein